MKTEKNNLVFFAMGEMYNKQCVFAILSLLNVYNRKLPESLHIYVYTNQPEFFSVIESKFGIKLIQINQDTINKWLNGQDYFLLTKISVVKDFLENYPGNMVFVDTDVIFKRRLDSTFKKIAKGEHVLHLREEKLSSEGNIHFLKAFQDKKFILSSGRTITIGRQSEMWNSGLIGLSSQRLHLVDDVMELCQKLIPHSSSRFLEQLSFSLVLQDTGKLTGDHKKLVHYWWKKSFFNPVINEVIDGSTPDIGSLLNKVEEKDPTNRTIPLRVFYNLHPNGLLRKIIVKTFLMLKIPIK